MFDLFQLFFNQYFFILVSFFNRIGQQQILLLLIIAMQALDQEMDYFFGEMSVLLP